CRAAMARADEGRRRLGERSGPVVSLSGIAGLPPNLGPAGRRCLGACARPLHASIHGVQRCTGGTTTPPARARAGVSRMSAGRILMTTDTVGGVWTYATTLARGLADV